MNRYSNQLCLTHTLSALVMCFVFCIKDVCKNFLSPVVSHGAVAVPFEGGIIGLFNITLKAGQTAYDLIDLKKRTNDSEYATQLIFKVGQALEEYTQMPMDLSSFDERTWKFFKTVVETDAQDLTTNSQRYFKDPSSFQERNLLRYCRHNQTLSTWFVCYLTLF
uniref:PDEase domain-containing protein n=1 Tax=Panagrellus redivivus TaxID=6233 RepID=A0A7E4VR03_PANRE